MGRAFQPRHNLVGVVTLSQHGEEFPYLFVFSLSALDGYSHPRTGPHPYLIVNLLLRLDPVEDAIQLNEPEVPDANPVVILLITGFWRTTGGFDGSNPGCGTPLDLHLSQV